MNNRLLVVDNEPFDREIMRRIFMSLSIVGFADEPDKLREKLLDFSPHVIFYELRTPDEDSLKMFFSECKKHTPEALTILSITENSLELEKYARVSGVFYYLIRPFNLKELWDAVECAFACAAKKRYGLAQSGLTGD